jgi:hypothetical protein
MAYTKQTWIAPEGTDLNKFLKTNETALSVELTHDPTFTNTPTPFSAARMNYMEDGIEAAASGIFTTDVEARTGNLYFSTKNTGNADLIRYVEADNTYHLLADAASPTTDGLVGGATLKVQTLGVGSGGVESTGDILISNTSVTETISHVRNSGSGFALFRATEANYLGTFFGYDAGGNVGVIGVHNAGDENPANDIVAITLNRGTGAVGVNDDLSVGGDISGRALTLGDGGVNSYNPNLRIRRTTTGAEPTTGLFLTVGSNGDRSILPLDTSGTEIGSQNLYFAESLQNWVFAGDLDVGDDLTVGGDFTLSTAGAKLVNGTGVIGFIGQALNSASATENQIFDFLDTFIPNNGDSILVRGVLVNSSTQRMYVISSITRIGTSNMNVSAGIVDQTGGTVSVGFPAIVLTDGGSTAYGCVINV